MCKPQPVEECLGAPENDGISCANAGDLMEGGKPPRDCKQSLRPYGESYNFAVGDGAHDVPKTNAYRAQTRATDGRPYGE